MNGDKKNDLRLEDGDLGSIPVDCPRQQQSIGSKHLKGLGIGIMGLLLFAVLTHSGSHIARDISELSTEPGYPGPNDGEVVRCIGSADWDAYYDSPPWGLPELPLGSESLFSLPVDSEAFYFVTRGDFQYGTIAVEQSTESSDNVFIRVRAEYYTEEALDRVNVCHTERGGSEGTIGIYTPKRRLPDQDSRDLVRFSVTFILPAVVGEDVLYIKKLMTMAPLFLHRITALADTVFFGTISLNAANFPIEVQSVAVETGTFITINGPINGRFRSTSSLKLATANMPIDVDVDLFHGEGVIPSGLDMTTMNAHIDARVSLTTASGSGGKFGVNAHTVNAPLTLTYVDSPLDSQLISKANTMNSPAIVHLHGAFEGAFSVKSSIIQPSLEKHVVEDPAGEGRERSVTMSRSRGHIQGSVRWVGDKHSKSGTGFVEVSTALSPARLIL